MSLKTICLIYHDLKQNEFKDLFANENNSKSYVSEVSIDTDLELLFPDYYIKSVNEREDE